MKARGNVRILRYAIAGSLAVHAIFAAVVHSHPVVAAPEQKPRHTEIIVMVLPKPRPTPQPPQKPQPPNSHQNAQQAHRSHINLVHTKNNGNTHQTLVVASYPPGTPGPGDDSTSAPTDGPSVIPVPSVTPKPACSAPDVAARTIEAVAPQTPPELQGTPAQAKVKVDLDASGAVTGTSIYVSSGYPQLDREALRAAQSSRYAAEEEHCRNVPGSYLFTVDFQE